jgi:glycerophosphoryl diester phosphodiesterase
VRDELLAGMTPVLGPSIGLVRSDPEFVERAHTAGKDVHVWTVNRPRDMDLMARLGVDAIITDHPEEVIRRLGRGPTPKSVSA